MTTIAILSDIHGNPIALDAVLEDIRKRGGAEQYWILGDLAAIGHDPIGTLEKLARLPDAMFVRGNTDRYLTTGERPGPTIEQCAANPVLWPACVQMAGSLSWTQGAITASGWRDWLASLPLEYRTVLPDGTRVLCVHAVPGRDASSGLYPAATQKDLRRMASDCDADLLLVGHTHWAMDVTVDGVRLVNSGSVSNPYPPDLRASYVTLEADETGTRLQHHRVSYDHQAVIEALQNINHPAADYIAGHMRGENLPHWSRAG
ncbi:MAG TPA: metallophosphoesterase family protein, partial [Anaerolineae bacterium]|nr:metallophosphoesterase family protein [Anaerolineae bacterium]